MITSSQITTKALILLIMIYIYCMRQAAFFFKVRSCFAPSDENVIYKERDT